MNIKIIFTVFLVAILVGCAGSARKAAKWEPVNTNAKIICITQSNDSGMLFVSNLRKEESKSRQKDETGKFAENMITVDAKTDTGNTFIVRKRLQRYISSIGDYSTLSALELKIEFSETNGNLTLVPKYKKEYQVSVAGEWPIPEMNTQDLLSYLNQSGNKCEISSDKP